MKFLKIFLLSLPILFLSSAFAIGDYTFPQDITTDTGSFPLEDDEAATKPLEMQKEEAPLDDEAEIDSFGQDEYNENVDPDVLDDNEVF